MLLCCSTVCLFVLCFLSTCCGQQFPSRHFQLERPGNVAHFVSQSVSQSGIWFRFFSFARVHPRLSRARTKVKYIAKMLIPLLYSKAQDVIVIHSDRKHKQMK